MGCSKTAHLPVLAPVSYTHLLFYNSFEITALGDVGIKQSRELLAEGQSFPDQPQRARVRLEVSLDLFQRSYDENRSMVESLQTALQTPNAVLQWTNDAAGVDYVNQTAVLVSEDLPCLLYTSESGDVATVA